jgi:tetratricopeptide (TPR) repeat protein
VEGQLLFEQARTALKRGDLDGTVLLLLKALERDPAHVEARRYLRAAAIRRQEQGQKRASAVGVALKMFLVILLSALKRYRRATRLCDRHLAYDPNNAGLRELLARALAEQGYRDAAICEFEAVHDLDPQRKEALRSLGRLYKSKQEIARALERYEELRQLEPHDPEATRETQQLAAEGAILKGGWETSVSYREVVKDIGEAEQLEEERAVSRQAADLDSTIARQQELTRREPTIASHYIRLGDLLSQARRLDEAEQAYLRAKEINPVSFDATERLGDLKLLRVEQKLQDVKEQLEAKPRDLALTKAFAEANRRRLQVGIEEFATRVQAHPTDTGLRVRLGILFYEAGEYDKAIAEFQQAQDEPRHMLRALSYLGLCFLRKGMADLAVSRFKEALARVEGFTETSKELIYNLGSAYEQMGQKEEARAQYEKIYERDITFRDVKAKLEALYKETHKSS